MPSEPPLACLSRSDKRHETRTAGLSFCQLTFAASETLGGELNGGRLSLGPQMSHTPVTNRQQTVLHFGESTAAGTDLRLESKYYQHRLDICFTYT